MRTLYIIACCLFVTAISSNILAQRHFSTATMTRAKSTKLSPPDQMRSRETSKADILLGEKLTLTGLLAAVLGVTAWIASFVKGRHHGVRFTPTIPLFLCLAYVMNYLGLA